MKKSKKSPKAGKDRTGQERKEKKPKNMVNWRETVESYLTRVINRYRSNCFKDGSRASPDFLQLLATCIAEDQALAKVTHITRIYQPTDH